MRLFARVAPPSPRETLCRFLVLALLFTGCSAPPSDRPLGAGFLLGVATAGFQNDPGCPTLSESECIDKGSDWYHFVTAPEITQDPAAHVRGEPLSNAPGSYELFQEDFDLVKNQLAGNAVRLSLEWSRIFPNPTFDRRDPESFAKAADPKALDHYHKVFAALSARGLKPLVTLNHYTLPAWIHDTVSCHQDLKTCKNRGWLDQRLIPEITRFAAFCAKEFGGEVDLWATLNEPFAVVVPGYLLPTKERTNPPAVGLAFAEAKEVTVAMIRAHARMYDAIRAADDKDADGDGQKSRIGLVYNMTPTAPADPQNPDDVQGAKDLFYLYNEVFLNAVLRGDLDEKMDGNVVHDESLKRMDYLGINYYTRIVVQGTKNPSLPGLSPKTHFQPLTLSLWNEYPRGLTEMILYAGKAGVPVIITENGTADQSDEGVSQRFLVQHLGAALSARDQGAKVEGYFYWTLVDNYEWNHGMSMRFGLFGLSAGKDKKRVPRKAAATYREIGSTRALSAELSANYPLADLAAAAIVGKE